MRHDMYSKQLLCVMYQLLWCADVRLHVYCFVNVCAEWKSQMPMAKVAAKSACCAIQSELWLLLGVTSLAIMINDHVFVLNLHGCHRLSCWRPPCYRIPPKWHRQSTARSACYWTSLGIPLDFWVTVSRRHNKTVSQSNHTCSNR